MRVPTLSGRFLSMIELLVDRKSVAAATPFPKAFPLNGIQALIGIQASRPSGIMPSAMNERNEKHNRDRPFSENIRTSSHLHDCRVDLARNLDMLQKIKHD